MKETSRAAFSRNRDLGFACITQDQREKVADEFARLARRWVLVFCDVESAHLWRSALEYACGSAKGGELEYVRTLFWRKLGATPQFTGDRPASHVEAIVAAHRRGRKHWNGGGRGNVYEFPIVLDRGKVGARLHTTQKPLDLMLSLVADFTDPGETVLDPYAGSGTTGEACLRMDRSFIGWELDPNYADIARRRLSGAGVLPVPAGQMALL